MEQSGGQHRNSKRPAIEWVAGGLGLLITIALIGFIGWQALQDTPTRPQIDTRVTSVGRSGNNYLVEIIALNRGSPTVAGLHIEGILTIPGKPPEKSSTMLDYVPGHSQTRGGLYFDSDPAEGNLQVSATGYQRP